MNMIGNLDRLHISELGKKGESILIYLPADQYQEKSKGSTEVLIVIQNDANSLSNKVMQ